MSFFGGGSDRPEYFTEHGGAVLSATIDKYVTTVVERADRTTVISAEPTEDVSSVRLLQHAMIRETLLEAGIEQGIRVSVFSDIRNGGTGLGSSAALITALFAACAALSGRSVDAPTIAASASEIEINRCGRPVGHQDQWASAHGGLNFIEFRREAGVRTSPVGSSDTLEQLRRHLILVDTGIARDAGVTLGAQASSGDRARERHRTLSRLVQLAEAMAERLRAGSIEGFGQALDETWHLKRALTSGHDSLVERLYAAARSGGATGGKLLGAGRGGHLLLYVDPPSRQRVLAAIKPFWHVPFSFENRGTALIVQA